MCLLAVLSRVHPDSPLIVAANRDEWLARPAAPFGLLGEAPRIVGGRDLSAGGTWMATSEHGVVAALTNRPVRAAVDGTKRSRGELPLLLARHQSAAEAAVAFCRNVKPADYNPCWLLVGDGERLFYIDVEATTDCAPRELGPGTYVLENRPLGAASAKAELVEATLSTARGWHRDELIAGLASMLSSHERTSRSSAQTSDGEWRPEAVDAACVHAGPYGTRSSSIVVLPTAPKGSPRIWHAEGAPCAHAHVEVTPW